jgi:cytochrome b6-f complex iron-sulfur subunit
MTTENQSSSPEGKTPATPATTPAAAKAPAPAKAAQKKEEAQPVDLRRRVIWACVWGYLGINLFWFLRFFFPRVLFEPSTVFSIGYPSDFALGVDTKFQKDYRIWVVRNTERLFVIYARCTHLGCTPDWKPSENKFKCPCHGSGYRLTGVNFEGPAPRPLERARVALSDDGQILVDKSRKFQYELGQWKDPDSFLKA